MFWDLGVVLYSYTCMALEGILDLPGLDAQED